MEKNKAAQAMAVLSRNARIARLGYEGYKLDQSKRAYKAWTTKKRQKSARAEMTDEGAMTE
jgi:hypothetical protein